MSVLELHNNMCKEVDKNFDGNNPIVNYAKIWLSYREVPIKEDLEIAGVDYNKSKPIIFNVIASVSSSCLKIIKEELGTIGSDTIIARLEKECDEFKGMMTDQMVKDIIISKSRSNRKQPRKPHPETIPEMNRGQIKGKNPTDGYIA